VNEDVDTKEDIFGFFNMVEMAIHTLKGMIGYKASQKYNEEETSCIKCAAVKTKYPADLES